MTLKFYSAEPGSIWIFCDFCSGNLKKRYICDITDLLVILVPAIWRNDIIFVISRTYLWFVFRQFEETIYLWYHGLTCDFWSGNLKKRYICDIMDCRRVTMLELSWVDPRNLEHIILKVLTDQLIKKTQPTNDKTSVLASVDYHQEKYSRCKPSNNMQINALRQIKISFYH